MSETNIEIADRLVEIRDEIYDLLEEAFNIIPEGMTKERAKCYWYAHIKTALSHESEYLGGSSITMEDAIKELREDDEEETDYENN